MCTLILRLKPESDWPLVLGGNRDELRSRPALPPGRHWREHPGIVAGRDLLAGGSWLGLNDDGVVAVVLNRKGTLGPAPGRLSRGRLVIEALSFGEAGEAVQALERLEPEDYRPFNLVVADRSGAWWLRHAADGAGIVARPVPAGLHLLASTELDDPAHPRVRRWLDRLRRMPELARDPPCWPAWRAVLASREAGGDPLAAMNLDLGDFGTTSSHLLALPREGRPRFLYAAGPPDLAPFEPVPLDPPGEMAYDGGQ
ncbi:MAG: hypothetical protein D6786_06075 [Gammaproteobacteria bacterium]|nr:MAG: hypothetical protein D6786_06075 [Gammaproteobacteria bacterium]